jgi:hypothetical protein
MLPALHDVAALVPEMSGMLTELDVVFDQIDWAEDEIRAAQTRHPAAADRLFHSFSLLKPTHEPPRSELLVRAHCRELLDRVATGADTRPPTAAEICALCSRLSHVAPFTSPAVGLYARAWAAAFPHLDSPFTKIGDHEPIYGDRIDHLETLTHRRLTVPTRVFGTPDCAGLHHGERVRCRFDRPTQLSLTA